MSGALEYLRDHMQVKGNGVAVIGFCMGGMLALKIASERPDLVRACVPFYGFPNLSDEQWAKLTARYEHTTTVCLCVLSLTVTISP